MGGATPGCVPSFAELRRTPPVASGIFESSAVALARCVEGELKRQRDPLSPLAPMIFAWADEDRGRVAVLRGGFPGGDGAAIEYPVLELRVAPESGVTAFAELRVSRRERAAITQAVWARVGCCARTASSRGCGPP